MYEQFVDWNEWCRRGFVDFRIRVTRVGDSGYIEHYIILSIVIFLLYNVVFSNTGADTR